MIDTSRRGFLGAGALVSLGGASAVAATRRSSSGGAIEADLLKYVGFDRSARRRRRRHGLR